MNIRKVPFITVLVLLGIVVSLSSCTDKSKLLVGTWRIDDLKYEGEIPSSLQQVTDNWIKNMKTSYKVTYRADNTYTASLENQPTDGHWKLNWNSTAITSTGPDNQPKTFQVDQLDDEKFVFRAEEGGQEVTFYMVRTQ